MIKIKLFFISTCLFTVFMYLLGSTKEYSEISSLNIMENFNEKSVSYEYAISVNFKKLPSKPLALNKANYLLFNVKKPEKLLTQLTVKNYDEGDFEYFGLAA